MTRDDHIEAHRRAGRMFRAGEVSSFVREEGQGPPVVCMHGVPASCYLYRKVLPLLAQKGLRGLAFDLPGAGFSERPRRFDYSWSGLGRFAHSAVDALGLDRFHLVVHDIGGPVGFELAAAIPHRILSLTILNTVLAPDSFRRPRAMRPFAVPFLGALALLGLTEGAFLRSMRAIGILDWSAITKEEILAYVPLLKNGDGGRAFLRTMRGFELTQEKTELYRRVVSAPAYPVQIVWGKDDPGLRIDRHGELARKAAPNAPFHAIAGKHFLQEDQAPNVAEHIARFVRATGSR